jgi:hypothetical protein
MNEIFGSNSIIIFGWLFGVIVVLSGVISDSRRRRHALEVIKLAIEKGQPLDPALVEKLLGRRRSLSMIPNSLVVTGILCISGGIGVILFGFCLGDFKAILPVAGMGMIVILTGIGMLISAGYVRRNQQNKPTQDPTE